MGNNLVAVDLGDKATHIAVGGSSACAVLSDDSIKCWWDNIAFFLFVRRNQTEATRWEAKEIDTRRVELKASESKLVKAKQGKTLKKQSNAKQTQMQVKSDWQRMEHNLIQTRK